MALVAVSFTDTSPAAPTLTGGATTASGGVRHPSIQTIGVLSGTGSADGQFNDSVGFSQIDYDSAGYLYVADGANNRVQRFTKASGTWAYDSKVAGADALGGGSNLNLVVIDRTRNEIHLAARDQFVDSTWVGVWSLDDWPSLTTLNRVRSYGSNANVSAAGKTTLGLALALSGDHAVAVSFNAPFRIVVWNHTTGALVTEETQAVAYNRIVADASGNWYGGAPSLSAAEPGLWQLSLAAGVSGVTRLDTAGYSGSNVRRNRLRAGTSLSDVGFFGGRIYGREDLHGRILAWRTSDLAYLDEFAWPGAASASESYGHSPGQMNGNSGALNHKFGFVGAPSSSRPDEIVFWSSNADNSATQSFLTALPISASTATWTYSGFANAGTKTLKGFSVTGKYLAAEKVKLEYRKNAGSWLTVPYEDLYDSTAIAALGSHTYNAGDSFSVRVTLSVWDRQDGHASLTATRDKLAPEEVQVRAFFEDPGADAAGALKVKLGDGAALKVKLGG